MGSVEEVRNTLLKIAKDLENTKAGVSKTNLPVPGSSSKRPSTFVAFESRMMNSFHVGEPVQNQINIAKQVVADAKCTECILIRVLEYNLFRLYFRQFMPLHSPETYNLEDFACLQTVITKKTEMVQSDSDYQSLSLLVQWKPLFNFIPDAVLAIPIFKVDQQVVAVAGLGFSKKVPPNFLERKIKPLKDFLNTVVPYAMINQARVDYDEECSRMRSVLDALHAVDNEKRGLEKCTFTIGNELVKLVGNNATLFICTVDYGDYKLNREYRSAKSKAKFGCASPESHDHPSFSIDDKLPIGWTAINRKPLRINDSGDCAEYGLTKKSIHGVGSCSCKNILCVPINDHSGEKTLVVELTDKDGGFSTKDFEIAALFIQNVASVYTCCVMLTHRERSSRRNSILSQVLLNVQPIKHMKVEQFLSNQRKNAHAGYYSGPFLEFHFSIKAFSEWDMSGGIFNAFIDFDILSKFKVRRATLIRFILSAQQGYRTLPYHNWQHACSVSHFAYMLCKKLRLIEKGYLTLLQAFALMVSGITHDVDHRGTNNRFQSSTNSDLFQLYNTQESILERHHLAITLAILRREDCNIIENLNPTDYKEFIELLTWNILATDIAKYIQTREHNFKILKNFVKGDKEHTYALLSLMMTASDVNDCVKPWDDSIVSAWNILTEFFDQGDIEKGMGIPPIAMMDRQKAYIPEIEFKFLAGIVIPVFNELAAKFPELSGCVKTLLKCQEYWEYATSIFDNNPDYANILDILKWPEMREDHIKTLANVPHRSLGEEVGPSTAPSKALIDSAAEDFRRMFSDKDAPEETMSMAETVDEPQTKCWARCCRRKPKSTR